MFEEEDSVLMEDASGLMPLFSFAIISEHVWAGERRGPGCMSVAAVFWVRETSAKGRMETLGWKICGGNFWLTGWDTEEKGDGE